MEEQRLFEVKPLNAEESKWGIFMAGNLLSRETFTTKEDGEKLIWNLRLDMLTTIAIASAKAVYFEENSKIIKEKQ